MTSRAPLLGGADSPAADPLLDELDRARGELSAALGADSSLCARLAGLRDRLQQQRLQIAILGQFKRGKSTFVNALLGEAVLPTGVVPLTAIPTFISWSDRPSVLVRYADGRSSAQFDADNAAQLRAILFRLVTEEGNPKNRFGINRVELHCSAPALSGGTVLIDTPGIGSTLAHNTEEALRILPECDASLFIVSADPPITQAELDYLRLIRAKTGRIFFIVNKVDYLDAEERRAVTDFLRNALDHDALIEPGAEIFGVSAKSGLLARQAGNGEIWQQSGMAHIERRVRHFLVTEKMQSLHDAIKRQAVDIFAQADDELALRSTALKMPFEELQRKSAELASALETIEAQRLTIGDLLSGERLRLAAHLEAEIETLRKSSLSRLTGVIDDGLSYTDGTWQDRVKSRVAVTIEDIFGTARGQFVAQFTRQASDALDGHRHRIDALIAQVRRTAARMFDVEFAREQAPETFRLTHEPYWVTERVESSLLPDLSGLLDCALPGTVRRNRRRGRIVAEASELVVRNTESLRWAILRGLDDTFRAASAQLDERLADATAATEGVIQDTLARRRDHSLLVHAVLERLDKSREALAATRAAFHECARQGWDAGI